MPYYRICPFCGAHLDPGESCSDCEEYREKRSIKKRDASQPAKQVKRLTYETAEAIHASNYRRVTALSQAKNGRYRL